MFLQHAFGAFKEEFLEFYMTAKDYCLDAFYFKYFEEVL